MAVFGAPVAHEDDAERAVRAALAIRDSIGDVDAALAYFEEERATPYVQRCRALMQASA